MVLSAMSGGAPVATSAAPAADSAHAFPAASASMASRDAKWE